MTAALVGAGVARDADMVLRRRVAAGAARPGAEGARPEGGQGRPAPPTPLPVDLPAAGRRPPRGRLRWRWLERCRAEALKPALAAWAPDAVVWDGHGAHTARLLADLPIARVRLPPYSPELNPAERVFQELRRRVEGRTYDTVADKQAIADAYLTDLAADPDRVRRLCAWDWLVNALDALPNP